MAPPESAPPTAAFPTAASPISGSSVPRPAQAEAAGAIGASRSTGARAAAAARPARPAADARPAAVLKGLPFSDLAAGLGAGQRPAMVLGPAIRDAPASAAGAPGEEAWRARPAVDGPVAVVPVDRLDDFLSAFEGDPALPGLTVALEAWVDGEGLPIRPYPPPAGAPPHRPRARKIRLRHRRRAGNAGPTAPLAAAPPLPPSPPPVPAPRRGLLARVLGRLFGGGKG